MKILHIILSLRGGGAERFVAQLIEHQIGQGLDARACIFQRFAIDRDWCRNIPQPYELDYTPKQGWRGPLATRTLVKQLSALLREISPDVIHTHLWPACNIVARATRNMSYRQVWHVHDMPYWLNDVSLAAFARRVQMRLMLHRSKPHLIACSGATGRVAAYGLKLRESEIITIRNGIDLGDFAQGRCALSTSRSSVMIIMAAAFRPLKGHLCLIEAVELLVARGLLFHVNLVGNTDSETGRSIREMVIRRGLSNVVGFSGHLSDIATALRASDIFVLPSESEALGVSIVEAMACGLPVVATRVGGIPEVVIEGETGYLVPPRNPEALASRLADLIESQELRTRMGALAAETARASFSFGDCADKVLRVYESLAPQPKSGGFPQPHVS